MTQTIPEPPIPPGEVRESRWYKKGQKVTEHTRIALLALIDAARGKSKPPIQAVAIRCGIKSSTLTQVWYKWKKGLIDLGVAQTPEEKEVNAKAEMLRTVEYITQFEKFLNDQLQGKITKVKAATAKGQDNAFEKMGINKIIGAMVQIARLREIKERGFLAIMDNAVAERRAIITGESPKTVEGKVVEVEVRATRATELAELEAALG